MSRVCYKEKFEKFADKRVLMSDYLLEQGFSTCGTLLSRLGLLIYKLISTKNRYIDIAFNTKLNFCFK